MWKLLRNLIIVAVLFVAVLKLLLWYETQQGAARLVERLAPAAQVHFDRVGAGLDGDVVFHVVSVVVGQGPTRETWRAAQVEVETPGALWLIRRVLLDDTTLPERLGITVRGLELPAAVLAPAKELAWFSPLSLVPFETLGCGIVSRFSVADYQRMGLNPGIQQQHVEYRYDSANSAISFSAQLDSPPFSSVSVHGDLQKFNPPMLAGRGNWQKLHVGEIALGYADAGYLGKRNRFCAQQAGTAPPQFVAQHMAAVESLLAGYGVQPSDQVTALYRSLVAEGGRISVLSLPSAASTIGELLAETPDTMTRRLNLTARRNEAPPVMVRLGFRAPEAVPAMVDADAPAAAPSAPAANPAPPPASLTATATIPPPTPKPPAGGPAPAKPAPGPVTPVATARPSAAPPPRAPAPAPAPAAPKANVPAQTAATKPADADADAENHPAAALPSGPAPPPDSTLALVWKPTVDRLGRQEPRARNYDIVEVSALGDYVDRQVRLITKTKRIEGRVIGIDATSVTMRIQKPGGMAELHVPRNIIVEVQVPHRRRSGDDG